MSSRWVARAGLSAHLRGLLLRPPHKCARSTLRKSPGLCQQVQPHLEQQRETTRPQPWGPNDTERTPGGRRVSRFRKPTFTQKMKTGR
ncbi:hypothetical protein OJAV_G00102600 [Oryzias javanicus]|uniref:Uncharacterized protein n=1 Tax=Oryzias javanicus TaxID=123683 RepID=A0A3S2PI86_ORYJA|nr:hypothetical protein OJAV_G00102600 [Oryzias javanicus]